MKNGLLPLLLLASSAVVTADESPFPLTARRIVFLGDSITNSGYYIADIEAQLRLQGMQTLPEMINLGLSSETCSGLSEPAHPFPRPNVHERLQRALDKLKPDVVVACYGMNDGIYHPFDQQRFERYQQGLTQLVTDIHASGAKAVILTPPPFDPLPLRDRPGKLVGIDAEQFAWFAVYEDYDKVIRRYSDWVQKNAFAADMVINIHQPIAAELAERRREDPGFHVAHDGVHMDETGHEMMARAILAAWGVGSWEPPSEALNRLLNQRQKVLHDAWLSDVGHLRPGVKPGLPVRDAQQKAKQLLKQIEANVKAARSGRVRHRPSTGGTVYSVHYPADLADGLLKLNVDYHLWIPEGVSQLRGIIVHQHGCGPGASLGGRTAADDLHWQELARRQQCALLGSSYEPRRGVDCRQWCDARRGSARQFLRSLDAFALATDHSELATVPWCLWGHSGGGFWASLMQTMYPQRIVAIWLQSGTAYGYWTSGEIPAPKMHPDTLQVPVMAVPGLKEKTHERFHRAYEGSSAMVAQYQKLGAPFIKLTADPVTSHECGDSRYLAIPYFDFWLERRIATAARLSNITAADLAAWEQAMEPRRREFERLGYVDDATAPPAPREVRFTLRNQEEVELTWQADADFESGIQAFTILYQGKEVARVPEVARGRFGRPLFQAMSYHDTPETPLPKMRARLKLDALGESVLQPTDFSVCTVNASGLISRPAAAGSH